jgi:7,8-dihydroneopterin aldolase/epimerase/oxygenase
VAVPTDAVFVSGIEFEASHGNTAAERRSTRRFRCNVELSRDLSVSVASDRLRDTIDYFQVCAKVVAIGTGEPFRLIEALAGKILDAVHADYPDSDITLTLEKLHPPCPGAPAASGVRLSRAARFDESM